MGSDHIASHPAHPDKAAGCRGRHAEAPSKPGSGGKDYPATPPLKICVGVLLEACLKRIDSGLDRDSLVDDGRFAGIPLGPFGPSCRDRRRHEG